MNDFELFKRAIITNLTGTSKEKPLPEKILAKRLDVNDRVIRKALEELIEEKHLILSSSRGLWIENDQAVGFVVGYVSGESFHIWCAYGILKDVKESFRQLEDMVKDKCTRITFESWRSGWDKVARKLGFNPRGWVKEL